MSQTNGSYGSGTWSTLKRWNGKYLQRSAVGLCGRCGGGVVGELWVVGWKVEVRCQGKGAGGGEGEGEGKGEG